MTDEDIAGGVFLVLLTAILAGLTGLGLGFVLLTFKQAVGLGIIPMVVGFILSALVGLRNMA